MVQHTSLLTTTWLVVHMPEAAWRDPTAQEKHQQDVNKNINCIHNVKELPQVS